MSISRDRPSKPPPPPEPLPEAYLRPAMVKLHGRRRLCKLHDRRRLCKLSSAEETRHAPDSPPEDLQIRDILDDLTSRIESLSVKNHNVRSRAERDSSGDDEDGEDDFEVAKKKAVKAVPFQVDGYEHYANEIFSGLRRSKEVVIGRDKGKKSFLFEDDSDENDDGLTEVEKAEEPSLFEADCDALQPANKKKGGEEAAQPEDTFEDFTSQIQGFSGAVRDGNCTRRL